MSTFFKNINDSEAGQLLALGANFSGFSGIAVQVVEGIISLLSQSDTDRILNAIGELESQLQVDFKQLGDLIKRQTQILQETVNRDAVATALSHSDAALFNLTTFLRTRNDNDLRFAVNESIVGVDFFLELGQVPPDVFFLPGLIKAGTIRISVIVVQDPNFFTSRPDAVNQIRQMVTLLAAMINPIKQRVDAAHVVTQKSHSVHTFPTPRFIIDGFGHDERVTDADGNVVSRELQFFPASGLPEDPSDPGAARALAEAQNARNQGVADELAFMGIPAFEAILQNWKTVLTNPNALRPNPATE